MYSFYVNSHLIKTDQDKKLLHFLRENLGLYGTKDGCDEGSCGSCTVIIDNKAVKSCIVKTSKLEGAHITTIEGLSLREQAIYGYCFAKEGAVQCGFCTPGMIMSAKALLGKVLNPSLEEIQFALRGNICRCTGYKKIEKAILEVARYLRENLPTPDINQVPRLNMPYIRPDAIPKAMGKGKFADDIHLEGMLHLKVLRSAYPRARIVKLDLTRAKAHSDCVAILTSEDVPENKLGHIVHDWDVMIPVGQITRYTGDAIALIASKTIEALPEILGLIQIEYEVLKPVLSPEEAMDPTSAKVHEGGNLLDEEHIVRGDAKKALSKCAYTVSCTYETPYTEHAFMERECAVATPEGDGVCVYTGSQSIYDEQREISRMLNLPLEKIHVHSMLVGGGFGGKEDMSVQHLAALMAYKIKKPVKLLLSRQESLMVHPKRHPMKIKMTTGCDDKGFLVAQMTEIIANTGAYASLGGPVLQRACTHASGPYKFKNFEVLGKAYYTNMVPSGAFRGFGVTQSCFACENNMSLLAKKVGMDSFEFKLQNALSPGDVMPNGQIIGPDCGIRECLEKAREAYYASDYTGMGCALKNTGLGVGIEDAGRVILSVENKVVHVRTSAACMGQGIAVMATQMLGETLKLRSNQIFVEPPDTIRTPDSGCSTASRQTAFTGEAIRLAALKLKKVMKDGTLEDLEGQEFFAEFKFETDPITSKKKNPVSHLAYSFGVQVVELDETGKLKKVTAVHDVGTVVNTIGIEGQVEGGVTMGLGYALTEDFKVEDGYLKVKYGTLGLLRAPAVPPIESYFVTGPGKLSTAYGAKGIGELSSIPTAPACSEAYFKLDGKFRTKLPLEETFYKKKK